MTSFLPVIALAGRTEIGLISGHSVVTAFRQAASGSAAERRCQPAGSGWTAGQIAYCPAALTVTI